MQVNARDALSRWKSGASCIISLGRQAKSSGRVKWSVTPLSDARDSNNVGFLLSRYGHGTSLEYPRLMPRDIPCCWAQLLRIVHPDRGYNRGYRPFDHVRGVILATVMCLDHGCPYALVDEDMYGEDSKEL